jgi:hypothetical protein
MCPAAVIQQLQTVEIFLGLGHDSASQGQASIAAHRWELTVVRFAGNGLNRRMSQHDKEPIGEVETALLDAELFIKYGSPDRAMKRLKTALERSPRSIALRERMREIAAAHKHPEEAARHCLALASLYIERDDFDTAHDRLLEAKQHDNRISIATGLEAIRRARHPELQKAQRAQAEASPGARPAVTFAGDLMTISVFDAIQAIENSRLTGILTLANDAQSGRVFFNDGQIVAAESGNQTAHEAFRQIVEITAGTFDFQKSAETFPVTIEAASNTNLILDSLRQVDEQNA